jgi:hypothetical protein
VSRGGSWFNFAAYCRSAVRDNNSPGIRDYHLGFRLAISPEWRAGIKQKHKEHKGGYHRI